jgi:hypothetical protein
MKVEMSDWLRPRNAINVLLSQPVEKLGLWAGPKEANIYM